MLNFRKINMKEMVAFFSTLWNHKYYNRIQNVILAKFAPQSNICYNQKPNNGPLSFPACRYIDQ